MDNTFKKISEIFETHLKSHNDVIEALTPDANVICREKICELSASVSGIQGVLNEMKNNFPELARLEEEKEKLKENNLLIISEKMSKSTVKS